MFSLIVYNPFLEHLKASDCRNTQQIADYPKIEAFGDGIE